METPRADSRDSDGGAAAQAVTDEELFEAYLAARLQQALESLNAARDELAAKPSDFNCALAVMRKVRELRDAQAELGAQRHRLAAARAAAGLAVPPAEETAPNALPASPGDSFRAVQAEQAARIMAALAARPRTCPACQALLGAEARQCHCGYTVPPSLAGARTAGVEQLFTPATSSR